MPAGFRRDWTGVFVQAAPPRHPRFGVLIPIEDGEWLVSLGGGDGADGSWALDRADRHAAAAIWTVSG